MVLPQDSHGKALLEMRATLGQSSATVTAAARMPMSPPQKELTLGAAADTTTTTMTSIGNLTPAAAKKAAAETRAAGAAIASVEPTTISAEAAPPLLRLEMNDLRASLEDFARNAILQEDEKVSVWMAVTIIATQAPPIHLSKTITVRLWNTLDHSVPMCVPSSHGVFLLICSPNPTTNRSTTAATTTTKTRPTEECSARLCCTSTTITTMMMAMAKTAETIAVMGPAAAMILAFATATTLTILMRLPLERMGMLSAAIAPPTILLLRHLLMRRLQRWVWMERAQIMYLRIKKVAVCAQLKDRCLVPSICALQRWVGV